MGALITTCPATGEPIETGIETDANSMALTPAFIGAVYCPHCKSEHSFSKDDAFICERVDGVLRYSQAA